MAETPPSRPHEIEVIIARLGTLAGAAAGTAGFVYLVGGAVMWLRFWRSDLPADQALALVPRSDLLVIGMRVMILPALAAGALFLLLAHRRNGASLRPLTLALLAIPVVVLALVVPFSPGAYAWPVAALGLWYLWCRVLPTSDGGHPLVWRAAVAAMLASALVSVARQFDHPVRLPSATLMLTGEREPVTGVLVTAGADAVVVGLPEEGRLTSFARSQVETIGIGPALDRRSPSRSLLSMALGGDAWAATPLELWCGGESYGWTSVADLCRTQPRIASRAGAYEDGEARVSVACPARADRGCSGYLTLTTAQPFAVDDLARAAPVELGRTVFQVGQARTLEVALPVGAPLRRCLGSVEQPVRVHAVLSSDRAAAGPLNGEEGQPVALHFPRAAGDCTADTGPRARDPRGAGSSRDDDGSSPNDEGSSPDDDSSPDDSSPDDDSSHDDGSSPDDSDPPAASVPDPVPASPPAPDDSVVIPPAAETG